MNYYNEIKSKLIDNEIYKRLKDNSIVVVGNSTSSVCMLQMGVKKEGQRLFGNVNCC